MNVKRVLLATFAAAAVASVGLAVRVRSVSGARPAPGDPSAASPSAIADRPVSVVAVPVAERDMPIYIDGLGTVTAFNTVTVRSQVDGRIDKIAFREGNEVKKGDLLAQIDPRAFSAQLRLAQAALARDQATVNAHRISLDRIASLRQESLSSQQQLDDERAALEVAKAVTLGDEAQIESARLQLEYARIVAPISGVTGVRLVDAGNVVRASDQTGIVVITQIDPIAVFFTLPQDDLPRIAAQMATGPIVAEAMNRDGNTLLGKGDVALIDNQINQTTATIRLKAILPNPGRTLWPNQFVKVRLLLSTRKNAVVVPAAVIQRGPTGAFAYVVGPDDRANVRPVTVDILEGDQAVIGKGLTPGELVVTEGQYQLRPGARVARRSVDGPVQGPSEAASAPALGRGPHPADSATAAGAPR